MNTRLAVYSDKKMIIDICQEWLDESKNSHVEDLSEAAIDLLKEKTPIIITDNGMIVGLLAFRVYDNIWRGVKNATEDLFYIRKAYRGMGLSKVLISAFEAVAKGNGCKFILMLPNTDGGDVSVSAAAMAKAGYKLYGHMMRKDI